MNLRNVIRQLGFLLIVLGACMLLVGVLEATLLSDPDGGERSAVRSMLMSAGVGVVFGVLLIFIGRRSASFVTRREALLLVAMSWLIGAVVVGLPYFLWAHTQENVADDHPFRRPAACYFEAVSGMTTTGATVLGDIEAMPRALLLWRAITQWLGGLGIVVLFVAVLPMLGVGGKKLFQIEATGPTQPGVRPRIMETARILWMIYVGMTVVLALILRLCGMDWFDAISHTFTTMSTGGFSTRNASIAAYDSVAIEVAITIFMVLAGINFGLYYQFIRGKGRLALADPEARLYLMILGAASVVVVGSLLGQSIVDAAGNQSDPSFRSALRHGVFQVVSIQTTTGFATADFDLWGFVPKAVLVALMFVGGSAGSTSGGIKVVRILITFKVMLAEVERVFRPNVVRPIKVGSATVDPEMRLATLVYVLGILVLFLVGMFLLFVLEQNNPRFAGTGEAMTFATAATSSAATLNNIGPGLELVGAVQNYGWFRSPSLVLMSLLMVLGRLEVYAVFVLFVPRFWRSE